MDQKTDQNDFFGLNRNDYGTLKDEVIIFEISYDRGPEKNSRNTRI